MSDLGMEILLDHYKDPRNFGHLENPDIKHEEGNPSCGDQITIELQLDGDIIKDMRFNGKGCAVSQASASMLTEELIGKSLEYAQTMTKEQMLEIIGIEVNPMRLKCAMLALKATKIGAFGLSEWHNEDEEDDF